MDRQQRAIFLMKQGLSLREVALVLGYSYEIIRQWGIKNGFDAEARDFVLWQQKEMREEDKAIERLKNARPCMVCGKTFIPKNSRINCSTECSKAWEHLRYHKPSYRERHRVTGRTWYLDGSIASEYAKAFGWLDNKESK